MSDGALVSSYVAEARAAVARAETAPGGSYRPELEEAKQLLRRAQTALAAKEYAYARELSLWAVERTRAAQLRAELTAEVERAKAMAQETATVARRALGTASSGEERLAEVEQLRRAMKETATVAQQALDAANRAHGRLTEAEQLRETLKEVAALAQRALAAADGASAASRDVQERLARVEEEVKRRPVEAVARPAPPVEPPAAEPPAASPPAKPAFTRYVVKAGESLWQIAGRPDVYGNPLAWPLIHEANKASLRNGTIRAGQVLLIPRDVSPAEREAAIQKAMARPGAGRN